MKQLWEPFNRASSASQAKINSGTVTLQDGISIKVEDADKTIVLAISEYFDLDEVDALVLLRSFLQSEGLASVTDTEAVSSVLEDLLNAFIPFYHSERLSIHRILISLLRANESDEDPFHDHAVQLLSKISPDTSVFITSILSEYLQKGKLQVPQNFSKNPRLSAQWAKQNVKEQLGLLEVIFGLLWDYVPCAAPVVVSIFEAAYSTQLGNSQENDTLLLDEEGTQLQRDISTLWVIILIEILNLELVADPGLSISINPSENEKMLLHNSPESLEKVHGLIFGNAHPGYVCIFAAWAFYLKGFSVAISALQEVPSGFLQFLLETRIKSAGRFATKIEEQIHHSMVTAVLRPESGLFEMLNNFLTSSPLFVTSIAWRTGSTISDPNAVAYRSVLKGNKTST